MSDATPRADAVAELLDIVAQLPPSRRLLALRARLSALAAVMACDAPPSRESAAADLRAVAAALGDLAPEQARRLAALAEAVAP